MKMSERKDNILIARHHSLRELLPPVCEYCDREMSFSAVGFTCGLCQESIDAKTKSAQEHLERQRANGWKERDAYGKIISDTPHAT